MDLNIEKLRVMLEFSPIMIYVALKIIIEFVIDYNWILIKL